jgi:hypothetical protein
LISRYCLKVSWRKADQCDQRAHPSESAAFHVAT